MRYRTRSARPIGFHCVWLLVSGCVEVDKPRARRDTETQTDTQEDTAAPEDREPCISTLWYVDGDGDSYGDAGLGTMWSCAASEGWAARAEDCDDADPSVYPAAPEVCMDGRPNDCLDADGALAAAACDPGGPFQLSAAEVKLLGAPPNRGAGSDLHVAGDTNGDGRKDLLVASSGPNVFALLEGAITDRASLADATAQISAITIPAGDLDLDGLDDLVALDGEEHYGAWILDAPLTGEVALDDYPAMTSSYTYDLSEFYDDIDDNAGQAGVVPGDLNGDGWRDLVIGAPRYSGAFTNSTEGACPSVEYDYDDAPEGFAVGAAYVVYGPLSEDRSLSDADGLLTGENSQDAAGIRFGEVGDLDGDGLDDLFVASWGQCEGGQNAGAAYVVLGPAEGSRSLADADMKLVGTTDAGPEMDLSGAGDTNGDGYPDLLVGTTYYSGFRSSSGKASLFLGPPDTDRSLSSANASWVGPEGGWVGGSVASADDVDLDGYSDILVGAENLTDTVGPDTPIGDDRGAAALIYGPMEGTANYADLSTAFVGPGLDDLAGYAVSSAGDINSDGLPDLLIGSPYDDEAGTDAGAAYLILGGGVFFNGTYGP